MVNIINIIKNLFRRRKETPKAKRLVLTVRKVKRRVKRIRRARPTTIPKKLVINKMPKVMNQPKVELDIGKMLKPPSSSKEKIQKILKQTSLSTSQKEEKTQNIVKPGEKSRFHFSFRLPFQRKDKSKSSSLKLPISPKLKKRSSETKIPTEYITEAIVADVMSKDVRALEPNDTLSYAVRLFADKKISGAPVVKGTNLVGMLVESDIIKFIGSKELLLGRGRGLKTLGEIKVESVMHRNPITVHEYTKLSEVADLMNKYEITRLPVLDERRELTGILSRSDIMRTVSKKLLFGLLEKHEAEKVMKVDTDIDEILQIVERRGSIRMDEIQKRLTIPEDKIEEWGKILERHNLIEMFYPPIGKPEFRKKIS